MALKGSFKMFGAMFQNVYVRVGAIQGSARDGWHTQVEVFQDADTIDAWRSAISASQKAKVDYQQSLINSAQAAQAFIQDPDNQDKKIAHESAVVAEIATRDAVQPSVDAVTKAQAAIVGMPWQQALKISYVPGIDPIVAMYSALKSNPDYSGMTDA